MSDCPMAKTPVETRLRIMDRSEGMILDQGYAATSVDSVVEAAGVTKGAFYHHFPTKDALALALVERWAERDLGHLSQALERSAHLTRDPVQRLQVFVGLLEEGWSTLSEPYAGCLFASFTSEAGLFDDSTTRVIREALLAWREALLGLLREAAEARAPRGDVDLEATADMLTVIFEGSFIVSKSLDDAGLVARQLGRYRDYLAQIFGG